jgi:S-adenosylmethionine synthetase
MNQRSDKMKNGRYFFTSESVTAGHPDKMCDNISDAILDAVFAKDPNARVAVECLTKTGFVNVAGELTTTAYVEIPKIVRQTIKDIGFNKPEYGFDAETCGVLVAISEQSPDISQGVTEGTGLHEQQGAGDQGLMFGYASNETPEFMPLPIIMAHKLCGKLTETMKNNEIEWLRPDGKSQVTVEYKEGKPVRIDTVVIAAQHDDVPYDTIKNDVLEKVIKPVCGDWLDENTKYHINATGKFVIGGPVADAGLTGRKIIVDTYGGHGSHGGGCFSGKDPSKVDRSASYMARYIAKNVVAAGLADKCEVQLAYAIGVADPVSVLIHCYDTARVDEDKLSEVVRQVFPLTPRGIIDHLQLRRPIFRKTAALGHFGRDDPDFTWEKTDKVDELKEKTKEFMHESKASGEEVPLDG